jgi:hypothetical protein
MTGELITTEQFQEIPVRVISTQKDRVIPLNDIAIGIGYDKAGLRKIVVRNEKQFAPYICKVVTTSQSVHGDQAREYLCLTRDGIVGLLMRLNIERIQDPSKQARVLEFQRWAMKTLGKVMDGKIITPDNPHEVAAILEDHLRMAKALTEYAGVKPGIASAVAIATVEDRTGADLSWCRGLLPPSTEETGRLIPTEIGTKLGITPRQVNLLLDGIGYQERSLGGDWRLTCAGRLYGEEYPFSRNGHTGYQIKWKKGIVEKIANLLHQNKRLQTGLLMGELFG